jgi:hypothetical protein
VDDIALAHLGR